MLVVRDASEADLGAILAIYNHAIETTTAVFSYAPHTMAMRQEWFSDKCAKGYPVLVADRDGAVVGFATYGPFRAWPAYRYSVEHSVYVAEGARRQGIARRLMERLVDRARAQDFHVVIGGIVSENAASLELHAGLGFEKVAHFRQVGYKFGRWLDLTFMQVVLDTPREPREG
jgi:L-amino acid N-acyltransferase YncA